MTTLNSFYMKNNVVVCIVEEGTIKLYDNVQINGVADKIVAIEYNRQILESAEAGMLIGILLKNIQQSDAIAGEKILKLNLQNI